MLYNSEINKLKATEKIFELYLNPIVIKTEEQSLIRDGKIEVTYEHQFMGETLERRTTIEYPYKS